LLATLFRNRRWFHFDIYKRILEVRIYRASYILIKTVDIDCLETYMDHDFLTLLISALD
jgi:hypothetical protein